MAALLIILIIFLIYIKTPRIYENFSKPGGHSIELVVARYNEDLKWLGDEPFNKYPAIVYNKGPNDNFTKWKNIKEVVKVDNVGKCDHTFLYHVIRNYDRLADVTVFLPGSADMDFKLDKSKRLIAAVEKHGDTVFIGPGHEDVKRDLYEFKLDEWTTSHGKNKAANSESTLELAEVRPFGKWFESRFGDIKIKHVSYAGILAISKRDIQQHSVSRYKKLIRELENSSNPEVGHYFERSWAAVFHPLQNVLHINSAKLGYY